jgi:hypothetical protein
MAWTGEVDFNGSNFNAVIVNLDNGNVNKIGFSHDSSGASGKVNPCWTGEKP